MGVQIIRGQMMRLAVMPTLQNATPQSAGSMDKIIPIDVIDGENVELRIRQFMSRLCAPHGDIKSLDVFINPAPNDATGLCLVQMSSEAEVAAAVEALHGIRLVGCAAFLFRIHRTP